MKNPKSIILKIKDFFLIIAVFCATVLPATTIVLGGMMFISSCGDTQPNQDAKIYGIEWVTGPLEGDQGLWESSEEYSLKHQVFDDYTGNKFRVIQLPAGAKVWAKKAGTTKLELITLNSPASAGDTVVAARGVYHIPK